MPMREVMFKGQEGHEMRDLVLRGEDLEIIEDGRGGIRVWDRSKPGLAGLLFAGQAGQWQDRNGGNVVPRPNPVE